MEHDPDSGPALDSEPGPGPGQVSGLSRRPRRDFRVRVRVKLGSPAHGPGLSVLKSHLAPACIGVFQQLYCLCERRFVRTFDLQKGFSLSEAVNDGSGREMVWVPKI